MVNVYNFKFYSKKLKKNQYIKILKNVHLIDNFYIDIHNDK